MQNQAERILSLVELIAEFEQTEFHKYMRIIGLYHSIHLSRLPQGAVIVNAAGIVITCWKNHPAYEELRTHGALAA